MARSLPCSNLLSHPDKPLEEHLIKTSLLAEIFAQEAGVEEHLKEMSKIISLSHDIGKATEFFQDYLNSPDNEKAQRPETRHGLLSAVCAYFATKEIYPDNKSLLPFVSFVAVRRHHRDLIDLKDENISEKNLMLLKRQIESIHDDKFTALSEHLSSAGLPVRLNKKLLFEWSEKITKELRTARRHLRKEQPCDIYLLINLLFSILLDADKSEVVIGNTEIFQRPALAINIELIEKWRQKQEFSESVVNKLRESAYRKVVSYPVTSSRRIYSLNLPTGMGKTISSLALAMRLREMVVNSTYGKTVPRIIYTLPFLSIIDQNAQVLEKVLGTVYKVDSTLLLKHHHLAEIYYKSDERELEPEQAKIMIEGWNAEVIVTTFVQFFHTLLSNKNKALRKFHRFSNSIIILDEVQAIPVRYWMLIKELIKELAERFNAYFIISTATAPLIFDREVVIPVVDKNIYFKALNRTCLKIDIDNKKRLEDFLNEFTFSDNTSCLIVLNTIKSAQSAYSLLKDRFKDKITFLSTGIVPYERLQRINAIKNGRFQIVVSTQLVEAGVDIDFDVVVRDIAPLDCILQTAGRCNRNFSKDAGKVYIVCLEDENARPYSSYIYDAVLLDITKNILKKNKEIPESNFLQLIEEYYQQVSAKKGQEDAFKLLEAIKRLRYDSSDGSQIAICNFQLIEDPVPKEDVFIELNEEAQSVWKEFESLREIKDRFERKHKFDQIKGRFYQFVVSVPVTRINNNPPPLINGIRYVPNSQLEQYYDKETGFRTEADEAWVW